MPISDQHRLLRARDENDHVGKKIKIKTNLCCKIVGRHEKACVLLIEKLRRKIDIFLTRFSCLTFLIALTTSKMWMTKYI